jgi:hypothetical protein
VEYGKAYQAITADGGVWSESLSQVVVVGGGTGSMQMSIEGVLNSIIRNEPQKTVDAKIVE